MQWGQYLDFLVDFSNILRENQTNSKYTMVIGARCPLLHLSLK